MMQTFLPYKNYSFSAQVLDRKRLGKQRIEAYQILKTLLGLSEGWKNHPAVKMWRGHEGALVLYGIIMCDEWTNRGYCDTTKAKIMALAPLCDSSSFNPPDFSGELHASHRARLYTKMPEHYEQHFGKLEDRPYVWK